VFPPDDHWPFVPCGDQALGMFEDLLIGRPACSRFLLGSRPALIFHFALVEAHNRIVAEWGRVSMSASGKSGPQQAVRNGGEGPKH